MEEGGGVLWRMVGALVGLAGVGGFSKISCFPVLFSVGRFWLNGGKV